MKYGESVAIIVNQVRSMKLIDYYQAYALCCKIIRQNSNNYETYEDGLHGWQETTALMLKINRLVRGSPIQLHIDIDMVHNREILYYLDQKENKLEELVRFLIVENPEEDQPLKQDSETEVQEGTQKRQFKPTSNNKQSKRRGRRKRPRSKVWLYQKEYEQTRVVDYK